MKKKGIMIALAVATATLVIGGIVLIEQLSSILYKPSGASTAVIGGADGPTATFIAGQIGKGYVGGNTGGSTGNVIGGNAGGQNGSAIGGSNEQDYENDNTGEQTMKYEQITMEEAREIFTSGKESDYIIVDVRRPDEYAEGHIPGAINIANESIGSELPEELPDKEQIIYVYCRSGNRSKQASEKLAALGYSHIIEFGGILDWEGKLEK